MNPIVPLAGLGLLALMTMGKKSSAAAPPTFAQAQPGRTPTPESKEPSKATADMPDLLKQQMALALAKLGVRPVVTAADPRPLDGSADADAIRFASQVAGQLDAQGYHDAAGDLRYYIELADKQVAAPPEAAAVAAAAPPGLTQAQRDKIARVMTMNRDPAQLKALIEWMQTLPPSPERDSNIAMAQAIRLQLLEAIATGETLQKVDQVIKAPNATEVAKVAVPSPPIPAPQVSVSAPKPALPPAPVPVAPAITPQAVADAIAKAAPAFVPTVATPQPLPQPIVPTPSSPVERAAHAMVDHLRALEAQYGLTGARGRQNTTLVKTYQSLRGITADGKPGPTTLYSAAGNTAVDLPVVMYWPSGTTSSTVAAYKAQLSRLADKYEQLGRSSEAATLRAAIAREQGQNAGAPAASSSSGLPTVKYGDGLRPQAPNPYVKKVQTMLGISADGRFGSGTKAAVVAFQKKNPLTGTPDGIVGPKTWAALTQNFA